MFDTEQTIHVGTHFFVVLSLQLALVEYFHLHLFVADGVIFKDVHLRMTKSRFRASILIDQLSK